MENNREIANNHVEAIVRQNFYRMVKDALVEHKTRHRICVNYTVSIDFKAFMNSLKSHQCFSTVLVCENNVVIFLSEVKNIYII